MKNYRFARTENLMQQSGRHLHLVHGGAASATSGHDAGPAPVFALTTRTKASPDLPPVVAEVVTRLRRHEASYRECLRRGDREGAYFEAESAEILAHWLVQHGHHHVVMHDNQTGRPSAG